MNDLYGYELSERAWIWLSGALGLNIKLAEELIYLNDGLLPLFDSVMTNGAARYPDKIKEHIKEALVRLADDGYIDKTIETYSENGVRIVTRASKDYPALLREIPDPPLMLFVKGRLKADPRLPIAVIGARKCSDYGRDMAGLFGRRLARNGACVVSGMAVGCDSAAAWGALEAGGNDYPTVAVLGSGIDVVYPKSNDKLYDEITERGAVVSEYGLGTVPKKELFPRRNRIISGMSKGVLVIEAAEKSGTSITADCAYDQGRDVFAVPGRLTDFCCRGSNAMIKDGTAKPVFDVDDILSEYGWALMRKEPPIGRNDGKGLPREQKRILDELALGEKTPDRLCEILGMDISEINIYLTEMELSGIINKLSNGEYSLGNS